MTMIDDDGRLLGAFPQSPMVCFQRGKNLRKEICKARLPAGRIRREEEDGFKRCMRPSCRLCPYNGLQVSEGVQHW